MFTTHSIQTIFSIVTCRHTHIEPPASNLSNTNSIATIGIEPMILALPAKEDPIIHCEYNCIIPLMLAIAARKPPQCDFSSTRAQNPNYTSTIKASARPDLSPLTAALTFEYAAVAELLVNYCVTVNAEEKFGMPEGSWEDPTLLLATLLKSVSVCRVLLEAGGDFNASSGQGGRTALRDRCRVGSQNLYDFFRRRTPTSKCSTLLTDATHHSHLEIVKLLMENGAGDVRLKK